ncbi:MAG: hypothetical protein P8184_15800 [Calditrichia bacterium]
MWQGWVSFVLGIWLFLSGLIPGLQAPSNMIIVGVLAAIFGFWNYKMWQGFAVGFLGIWVFLSGIAFSFNTTLNFILMGVLIFVLGIWSALVHPEELPTKTV